MSFNTPSRIVLIQLEYRLNRITKQDSLESLPLLNLETLRLRNNTVRPRFILLADPTTASHKSPVVFSFASLYALPKRDNKLIEESGSHFFKFKLLAYC